MVRSLVCKRVPSCIPKSAWLRQTFFWNQRNYSQHHIKDHIYVSTTNDPHFNLALEYNLFRKTPAGSRILFLYSNRPCVVIGRNQNPWLEVNLPLLKTSLLGHVDRNPALSPNQNKHPALRSQVNLIRRKSGGGTVFHDEGNMNWSVICDLTEFTRDKHAEMVVRALRKLGIDRARVNKRHDIVLDQGDVETDSRVDPEDTHRTKWTLAGDDGITTTPFLKVSGSAYKMSGNRALHHGTALLNSPNLTHISRLLRSPAKHYVSASGVDSVSSPVGNLKVEHHKFAKSVQAEFASMYGLTSSDAVLVSEESYEATGVNALSLQKECDELKDVNWTFLQTPKFTVTSVPIEETQDDSMSGPHIHMQVRQGAVSSIRYSGENADSINRELERKILQAKIHEIKNWKAILDENDPMISDNMADDTKNQLSDFLNRILTT